MTNAIYKQGTQKEVGTKTAGSLNTNSVVSAVGSYSALPVSAVVGTATGKGTIYKAGTQAVVGTSVGIHTIR